MKSTTENRGDQLFNVLVLAGLLGVICYRLLLQVMRPQLSWIEQRPSKPQVTGSNPVGRTNFMKWFLYVLQCSDGSYYTGVTTDLNRRIEEHNTSKRGAKYTKTRRPVRMVYSLEYEDRSSAQKFEYKFKQLTRKQKEEVINKVKILGQNLLIM